MCRPTLLASGPQPTAAPRPALALDKAAPAQQRAPAHWPGDILDFVSTPLGAGSPLPSSPLLSWGGGGPVEEPLVLPTCPCPLPPLRTQVTSRAALTFLFSLFHLFSFPFCRLFLPLPSLLSGCSQTQSMETKPCW